MKILFLVIGLFFYSHAFAADPMFYTQCERQNQPWSYTSNMSVGGVTQDITATFDNMDAYDLLPDVTGFLGEKLGETDFTAPCNLIHRAADGTETTVYQCSGRPDNDACAALSDGGMTFDGQEFMFTVYKGQLVNTTIKLSQLDMHPDADNPYFNARPDNYGWIDAPNKRLLAKGSTVYKVDINTLQAIEVIPYQEGVWNLNPVPNSPDRFWYLSNKHRTFAALVFNNVGTVRATGARSADIADGKNDRMDNTAPLMRDMNGTLMIEPTTFEAWIAYTKHLIIAGYPFRHDNGLAGSDGTLDNYAAGWMTGPYFDDDFPLVGQHMQNGKPASFVGIPLDAIRYPTQMTNYQLVWSTYYRRNNNALGALIRHTINPHGIEGPAPSMVTEKQDAFLPTDLENITPFTTPNDQTAPVVPGYAGILAGKFGHPEKLPNNNLMFSYGVGGCSTVLVDDAFDYLGTTWPIQLSHEAGYWGRLSNFYTHLSAAAGVQIPACKVGIYTANTLPINSPTELIEIVNRDEWHEIMPRVALSPQALYGLTPTERQRPDLLVNNTELEKGTPFHLIGGTISPRETEPCYGFDTQHLHSFHGCGTDTIEYTDADVAGVVVFGANPNPEYVTQTEIANTWGVGVNILGFVPVESDGSFGFYAPAEMPVTFGLVDDKGRLLNVDMNFDPGAPGEEKTCLGCHFHSDNLPGSWQDTVAGQNKSTLTKLGMFSTQRFAGRDQVGNLIIENVASRNIKMDYSDVQAVFDQFCASCHGATNPAGGLDLSTPPTGNPFQGDSTWKELASKNYADDGTIYQRPQLSKYIKAFNPLGSLLYWKAANQRMDKRTDAQASNDVDFGADHPTSITDEGLRIISEWIMLGAPAGTIEKDDRQPPTLTLHAIVSGDSVTGFKVGAVDSDSGLNTTSMHLCIVDGLNCNNIAPAAVDGGVVDVTLSQPILNTQWDKEVYVRVDDNTGNRRELRHTLSYLAAFENGTPPPPPPQAPLTIDAGLDIAINEGDSMTKVINVSGGSETGRSYSVTWGDGQTDSGTIPDGQNSFTLTRGFADGDNSFINNVSVSDSDSNNATDSFTVDVSNVAPTGSISGTGAVDVGQAYTFTVNTSDPGADTITGYSVDCGNGTQTNELSCTYSQSGQVNINVSVIDEDGTHTIGSHQVTVNDVARPACQINVIDANQVQLTECDVVAQP